MIFLSLQELLTKFLVRIVNKVLVEMKTIKTGTGETILCILFCYRSRCGGCGTVAEN